MTGTADTEAAEFKKIYNLDVVVVPTNMPMVRTDLPDVIYKTKRGVLEAVLDEIEDLHAKGQPVLVGTISIDVSEQLGKKLKAHRHPARGAQRQAPRAGGADRLPGRPEGRGHDLHQHGRPRAPTSSWGRG